MEHDMKLRSLFTSIALVGAAACGSPQTSDVNMIIGTNDQDTTVDNQDLFPYNGTAVRLDNGCSAGFISGQFLLTAAHCIVPPQTTATITNRFSGTQQVRVWARGDYETGGRDNDWAILVADEPIGLSAGSAALDFVPPAVNQGTSVVGYPGNLGGLLARSNGTIRDEFGVRYGHDADITGGSSGSIMGRVDGGTFRVNGIQSWHFWPDAASGSSQMCTGYATGNCANEAVSIRQFRQKAAEGQSLESMRIVADLNGDGVKDILMRDDRGLSFVNIAGGTVKEIARMDHNRRYGDWEFDRNDQIVMVRDFLREGRAEILIRSWWGIGILQLQADGQIRSVAMAPNGSRIGEWLLGAGDTLTVAGRFTTDGSESILIRSPWGMGLIGVTRQGFVNRMLVPHGRRFAGGWLFGADDVILGSLPMTYGIDRVLIRSAWGIGTLYFDTRSLQPVTAALVPYGSRMSESWLLGANDVVVTSGGDMNADGYGEFILRSAWGFGVIDAALNVVAMQQFGTRAPGGWLLSADNQIVGFGPAGTNGGYSLVVQSPWGLGFLTAHGGQFATSHLVPYGTRLAGGWLLGRRDRISAIGDLENSNGAVEELLIRSPWGLGVLKFDSGNVLASPALWPYGTSSGSLNLDANLAIPAR
jgi:hypothetical protein